MHKDLEHCFTMKKAANAKNHVTRAKVKSTELLSHQMQFRQMPVCCFSLSI